MNLAISSPDGLGDFILRLPILRALESAGHALQLWMLPPAIDLARLILPRARVEEIRTHPYTREARRQWRPFELEFSRIREFRPDRYVVSLYQPSFFDEMWIDHGDKNIPIAGLVSRDGYWPSETIRSAYELAESYYDKAIVDGDEPEIEKNRTLAEAILEGPCEENCHIEVSPAARELGANLLRERHFSGQEFWLVCVGNRPGLDAKDWGEENWIAALRRVEPSASFVFIGNEAEAPSIERIRAALAEPARHLNLAVQPPGFEAALGLAALSCGYLGRDSGPMHLVAAVGRPVLAVFAGGHWGRFFPQASRGVVLGARGACRGCALREGTHDAWCVKNMPLAAFEEAWTAFPNVSSLEVREWHAPGAALDADFVRQALEGRRARMRADRPRGPLHALARKLVSR